MKKIIKNFFEFFGFSIIKKETLEKFKNQDSKLKNLNLINYIKTNNDLRTFLENIDKTKSQSQRIAMDLFVLVHLDFKKNGYFVEFGGGNGILNSNTYLLEKEFGWKGILAEPGKIYYPEIINNRNCHIEKLCVWSKSNIDLTLVEAPKEIDSGMSSIQDFAYNDKFSRIRKKGIKYKVKSISLVDLLNKYNAPNIIDYISIDVEGSEYEVLKDFDFNKYKFNFITCEHMFVKKKRNDIYDLLTKKGYERIHENLSAQDDWYVPKK